MHSTSFARRHLIFATRLLKSAVESFPMDLGLKDCKAFIAGASKGLGEACAKALAGEGGP
jgi:hypothetical protein